MPAAALRHPHRGRIRRRTGTCEYADTAAEPPSVPKPPARAARLRRGPSCSAVRSSSTLRRRTRSVRQHFTLAAPTLARAFPPTRPEPSVRHAHRGHVVPSPPRRAEAYTCAVTDARPHGPRCGRGWSWLLRQAGMPARRSATPRSVLEPSAERHDSRVCLARICCAGASRRAAKAGRVVAG